MYNEGLSGERIAPLTTYGEKSEIHDEQYDRRCGMAWKYEKK